MKAEKTVMRIHMDFSRLKSVRQHENMNVSTQQTNLYNCLIVFNTHIGYGIEFWRFFIINVIIIPLLSHYPIVT